MKKPVRYHGLVHAIKDKRLRERYLKQLKNRGFDNTELWRLDETIVSFILPRLKQFIKLDRGLHNSPEFHAKVEKVIRAFEIADVVANENHKNSYVYFAGLMEESSDVYKEYKEGMSYFGEILRGLWL